ncbi:hypothetical protein ABZ234_08060 [Nocardiopsis sp. NPDC006198]|uniref:hypothetical protein n=1 Tax=Nocardiopsis sp. NPDC006198 TaxID=3154472 RepID=UPI0033BA1419
MSQRGIATTPPPVWVLYREHRHGEEITLAQSEEAAMAELARYVRSSWDNVVGDPGVPFEPPADDAEAIQTYFAHREEEYHAVWEEDVLPASAPPAGATTQPAYLPPDPPGGGDPAIEWAGIVVGVRRESTGLCVWVGTDAADSVSWPTEAEGVPVEIVVNDGTLARLRGDGTVAPQGTVLAAVAPQARIWVLNTWDKNNDVNTYHASEEGAQATLAEYVRTRWKSGALHGDEVPVAPQDDARAIDLFYGPPEDFEEVGYRIFEDVVHA